MEETVSSLGLSLIDCVTQLVTSLSYFSLFILTQKQSSSLIKGDGVGCGGEKTWASIRKDEWLSYGKIISTEREFSCKL